LQIAGHPVTNAEALEALLSFEPETVRSYDLAGTSPTDTVTLEDIGRLCVMAARLEAEEAAWLLQRGRQPDAPWASNPGAHTLDSLDSGPDGSLQLHVWELYRWFCRAGISDAKVSKLLHIKWPSFFPILDEVVRDVYTARAIAAYKASPQWQMALGNVPDGRCYWSAIRDDLVLPSNVVGLQSVRNGMRAAGWPDPEHVARLLRLGDLRLLDIITWKLFAARTVVISPRDQRSNRVRILKSGQAAQILARVAATPCSGAVTVLINGIRLNGSYTPPARRSSGLIAAPGLGLQIQVDEVYRVSVNGCEVVLQ